MPLLLKDLVERSGAAVVEEGVATADGPQGRGVELVVAHLVDQAHVVSLAGDVYSGGTWQAAALPRFGRPSRPRPTAVLSRSRRPRAAATAAPAYPDRRSGRRPGRRSVSARAWSSRSTCGPGPPAGPSSRSRSRGRSRRRPAATAPASARRTSRRPACRSAGRWCGRRCGSYGSSSSRRARASRWRTAARPGRRRSARAAAPARSSRAAGRSPIATTEIVSSSASAT